MTRRATFLFCVISLLFIYCEDAFSLDCPKAPEQISRDWESEVNATIAKIGPVKGGDLKTKMKKAAQDLLGKLPDAGKVYTHIFDDPSFTGVQIKYSSTDVASKTIKGIASAFKAANIDYKEITDGLSPDSQPKSIYLSISFKP